MQVIPKTTVYKTSKINSIKGNAIPVTGRAGP